MALRTSAWNSFDQRRDAEWKVPLGLWTAMSALIGILLSKDLKLPAHIPIYGGAAIVILVVLDYLFVRGLQNANRNDRSLAYCYDNIIETELLKTKFPTLVNTEEWKRLHCSRERGRREGVLGSYSHRFQVCITLLLGLCLWLVLCSK